MPAGIIGAVTTAFTSIGVGAATAGILADATLGAGLGAGLSAIEGGNIGIGALTGGLTGGALGFAPSLASELGISATSADILAGAASGAVGAGITGGDPLKGTLFGGLEGGLAAALSPSATAPGGSPGASAAAGGGSTAASTAATLGGTPDLTVAPLANAAPVAPLTDVQPSASLVGASEGITVGGSSGASLGSVAGGSAFSGALSGGESAGGAANSPAASPIGPIASLGGDQLSPAAGAGAVGSAPTTSLGKFVQDPSLKTAGNVLTSNPSSVIGALGLGYQALTQPHLPDQSGLVNTLKTRADSLGAQGATLMSFINNGQLPPGAMAAVNNATQSAKAALRSRYASLGLTGSTSEATALSQVDQQAATQVLQIADSLLQTGIKESGLSMELYKSILSETDQQSQLMSSAIANFAGAIAGGGNRGITLNVGQG